MQSEERFALGTAVRAGDSRLIPIVRLGVLALGGFAASCDAELVALVVARPGDVPTILAASEPSPRAAASWSAWLEERPDLLAELRSRLTA